MTNNRNEWYKEPVTLPSIGNSDHLCVSYVPKKYVKQLVEKKTIWIRRFKKSAMLEFGAWIANFNWIVLFRIKDVNDKVAYFSKITWLMVEELFPLEKIIISDSDKEWMTTKIKKLILLRQEAHNANLIEQREHFAHRVRKEIKKAKVKFNKDRAHYFFMSNPRDWYKHVNKIIGNKNLGNNFTNIPELGYKPIGEQIYIINNYFQEICNKHPPFGQ